MLSLKSFYGQITEVPVSYEEWTSRTSAANNNWRSVTWGNGLFVAVASSGTDNRVMTSPDGITWTSRTSAANILWRTVTYGNGLFVAVSTSGTGNDVMTSPDGITWTSRTSANDNAWRSVTYGNGLWVAVSESGTGNRVMTSPNGTTWTSRTSAADNSWYSVTYGNGLFVAVSISGSGNRVMTSPDGITWTIRTSAADNDWYSVTYGNGLFVAVSISGTNNRVMTSPDGITWTSRTSAANNEWRSVTNGNGLWVAVAGTGTGNRVMTSPDGITWTSQTSAANNDWHGVTYGNGLFVAVSSDGPDNRVMTWKIAPTLFYDSSSNLVTYNSSGTLQFMEGDGTISTLDPAPVVYYNPTSQAYTYNWTNPNYINDNFSLAAAELGSTIQCNNVLIPFTSLIRTNYQVSNGSTTSRMCTSTVWAPITTTVTGVMFYKATIGVYTANNYNGFGLYKFNGATGTLVASTTTDVSLLKGTANTFHVKPFTTAYTVTRGTYVIALVYSNSTESTAPTVGGIDVTASQPNIPNFNLTNGAKFSGFQNTVTALPNPLMWSNLTQGGTTTTFCPWFALY